MIVRLSPERRLSIQCWARVVLSRNAPELRTPSSGLTRGLAQPRLFPERWSGVVVTSGAQPRLDPAQFWETRLRSPITRLQEADRRKARRQMASILSEPPA